MNPGTSLVDRLGGRVSFGLRGVYLSSGETGLVLDGGEFSAELITTTLESVASVHGTCQLSTGLVGGGRGALQSRSRIGQQLSGLRKSGATVVQVVVLICGAGGLLAETGIRFARLNGSDGDKCRRPEPAVFHGTHHATGAKLFGHIRIGQGRPKRVVDLADRVL